jgi:hypothetical protein
MFIATIAQKAAETIAFGLVNTQLTSDQVFGVGLRHCYFSGIHVSLSHHTLLPSY